MVEITLVLFLGILLESCSPACISKHRTTGLSWLYPDELGQMLLT